MSQSAKVIDVERSFVVIDPNAYTQTMGYTKREDDPEETKKTNPYEGYNFMPTSYGYRSYFGQAQTDIAPLTRTMEGPPP